jgi:biofilm PGA synthesis N-glycosyltransferase PgaC
MPYALRRTVACSLSLPTPSQSQVQSSSATRARLSLRACTSGNYFLGIAAVKRRQALLQGTLVAQGSFSVCDTSALHRVNCWPNRIGEDNVLTRAMLRAGGRTTFEPTVVADDASLLRALDPNEHAFPYLDFVHTVGFIPALRSRSWSISQSSDL